MNRSELASRIKIEKRPVPGGAISSCFVVIYDNRLVASRLTVITPDEAIDMVRAAIGPAHHVAPLTIDKSSQRHTRPRYAPSDFEGGES